SLTWSPLSTGSSRSARPRSRLRSGWLPRSRVSSSNRAVRCRSPRCVSGPTRRASPASAARSSPSRVAATSIPTATAPCSTPRSPTERLALAGAIPGEALGKRRLTGPNRRPGDIVLTLPPSRLAALGPHPSGDDENDRKDEDHVSDDPHESARDLLVGQRGRGPRHEQVDRGVVREERPSRAIDCQREERVLRH